MLLANYAQQNRNCVREWGIGFTNPLRQFKPSTFNNFYTTQTPDHASLSKSAFNNGYNTSHVWWPALKAGGIASTLNLNGTGTISASILSVKLLEAAINGDGSLTAFGSLLVQALANITGSGGVSDADLLAFLAMVAAIGGSGDAEGTATGLAELLAALTGSGTLEDSIITGIAELIADLVVTGTGLTAGDVASAVWSSVASANDIAGSMGEKLNDAGSASNPWTEVIESGYTAEEILRLISAVLLGKVSGAGTGVETFTGIDGTTDRVIVEATMEGNRTAVTLDGA